jgi:uncharacterized membrane protein
MQTLVLAAIAFPIMFVLDLAWIGGIAHGFYRAQLGSLLSPQVVWPAALAFYLIYALALSYFVIQPAVEAQSLAKAALMGAFLGLAAYAAYDLTNWATIAGWPPAVSLIDLAWGVIVSSVTALVTYLIAARFLGH